MRLWSLHPSYLDTKGLVACWREALLARKVLQGQTHGFRHHPQLDRFKAHAEPIAILDSYLLTLWEEATARDFVFNREKFGSHFSRSPIPVTNGQLDYELRLLREKLKSRDLARLEMLAPVITPQCNPVFEVIQGAVEPWERVR